MTDRVIADSPNVMSQLVVRVAKKMVEAVDINSYELIAANGGSLPSYEAGAHVDVHLSNGLTRQYSLCGDPRSERQYRIAVLLDPRSRGGSKALHSELKEGDVLRIGSPRNLFTLRHSTDPVLLVAGGIGITPLLAMAYQLADLGLPFRLHYFVRTRTRAAFLNELMNSRFAARVSLHFDDEDGGSSVPEILSSFGAPGDLYACGPTGFIKHVLDAAERQAWPSDKVHFESFSPTPASKGAQFEVRLERLGRSVFVGADETVIAAVARLGICIPVSCEQGICGTCLTRVVDGIPDHRDMYLTEAERQANDQFIPCCSRALSPSISLDL